MCEIKDSVRRAFARHRLDTLAGFKNIPVLDIPHITDIPTERTKFPNSIASYWKRIETTPESNTTKCLFELGARETFFTHLHIIPVEKITLLTKGAKVEWVTEREIQFLEYPATFYAHAGEEHALVSMVDFPILYEIEWNPAMQGWEAIFNGMERKMKRNQK